MSRKVREAIYYAVTVGMGLGVSYVQARHDYLWLPLLAGAGFVMWCMVDWVGQRDDVALGDER